MTTGMSAPPVAMARVISRESSSGAQHGHTNTKAGVVVNISGEAGGDSGHADQWVEGSDQLG